MAKGERVTPAYIRLIITMLAGLLTIVLTAVAFWLSYEHLHDVAGDHGLSGERAWAWPATLDMFIVIGELLILRASLMQKIDPWSWVCASIGSVGSITLNVVGVGKDAGSLDYVIAAVPPVAALLAFGILMRQLHEAITAYVSAPPKIVPGARTVPPGVAVFDDTDLAGPEAVRATAQQLIADAYDLPPEIIGIDLAPAVSALRDADLDPEDVGLDDDDQEPEFDAAGLPRNERSDAPGQDASIDFLRRAANRIHNTVMDSPTAEQLSEALATVPPVPVNPPSSFVPARGYSADLFLRDEAVLGTRGDIYLASVGTPEPGLSPGEAWRRLHPEYVLPGDVPEDIGEGDTTSPRDIPQEALEDVPVPVSRPVPRPPATGTKPGAPSRVRDILGDVPGTTDEDLRDILRGEGFLPNTINKAIRRVRGET